MKKGLLLSIVASTFVFAGGDIVPMEPAIDAPAPAVPAPVAKCGNFSGSIGAYYDTRNYGDNDKYDLFDTENSRFDVTAAVAMEKELGYGITIGGEVAGWRDSHDIADMHRVAAGNTSHGGGEISQLWIAKSFGNTAIKIGRQALPASLMPFAWTDTTAGVKDYTYEGVVFANTSMKNTTLYGGWIGAAANAGDRLILDDYEGYENGLFALGFRTTSLWNLGLVGFYADEHRSVWGDVSYKVGGWDSGIQAVWADDDNEFIEADATSAVAVKFGKDFGKWDAKVVVSYIDGGSQSLQLLGNSDDSLIGGSSNSAFWGDISDNSTSFMNIASTGIGGQINVKDILNGKIYVGAGYNDYDDASNTNYAMGVVGYKTTLKHGLGVKAEYKFGTFTSDDNELDSLETSRVRLEAVYKF